MILPLRPTVVTGEASHVDLLSMASVVRRAAASDDAEVLHDALARLRAALIQHVHAEEEGLNDLPGAAADLVRDGQRRLLRLLSDVLFDATDGPDAVDCSCIVRGAEIEVALRRQSRLENALRRRAAVVSPPTARAGSVDRR